jgi:hypothetical protein
LPAEKKSRFETRKLQLYKKTCQEHKKQSKPKRRYQAKVINKKGVNIEKANDEFA